MAKTDPWKFVLKKKDTDRGFRLTYGKNVMGISWARKSDNLITRIVPVAKAKGGEDLYLPEKWIDSALINDYPIIRMERLSVSGQVDKAKSADDDTVWTETDLLDEMRDKAEEQYTNKKVDQIVEEITIDFEMLLRNR